MQFKLGNPTIPAGNNGKKTDVKSSRFPAGFRKPGIYSIWEYSPFQIRSPRRGNWCLTGGCTAYLLPPSFEGGRLAGGSLRHRFRHNPSRANTYFLSLIGGKFRYFEHRQSAYCGKLPPPFGPSPLKRGGARGAQRICPPIPNLPRCRVNPTDFFKWNLRIQRLQQTC